MTTRVRTFTAVVEKADRGGAVIPVPFDPDEAWGAKREHRVGGTVDGMAIRGSVRRTPAGFGVRLGPAWLRDCPVKPGSTVKVELFAEGPQRDDLAPDLAAALEAEPAAGEFFDSLAQFHRKAYLRWIDGTKRRPDERARRIAETIDLLKAGEKQRPG
jgi:hypothetical protein